MRPPGCNRHIHKQGHTLVFKVRRDFNTDKLYLILNMYEHRLFTLQDLAFNVTIRVEC